MPTILGTVETTKQPKEVTVDTDGKIVVSPTSGIQKIKPCDDAGAAGPYYIRSDTNGIPHVKPGSDGSSILHLLTDAAGQLKLASDGTARVVKCDANGQVYVLQAALMPGQDQANDWVKVKRESITTYAPSKTAATAITAASTIVLASIEMLGYTNIVVYVNNIGGGSGDDIDQIDLEFSPNGTSWGVDTSATALAWSTTDGVYAIKLANNGYRYLRVSANCGAGDDTTVDAWITANKG